MVYLLVADISAKLRKNCEYANRDAKIFGVKWVGIYKKINED